MAIKTADDLAQQALNHNLVDQQQLQDVWGEFGTRNVSLKDFRQALLRRDLLTFYQIETLIRGTRAQFFYGDYKVLYLVGTGTFARVYRATHRQTGQQVAIKVLRRRFSEQPDEADRFYREGQMGASLRHPNIVPIYEVHSQGLQHYLVIEFVEGRNLYEFMQVRKKLEPIEAIRIALDIAKGLQYALSQGVTHRDLKMSNVLIASTGQAKLVDFGLAGADVTNEDTIDENANPRAIDYAGLERATRVRKGDVRSDVYFLGCIFYQMLSGAPPLSETRDRTQRLSTGRFREITPISEHCPDMSPKIAMVVNKAIQFDPEKRYQSPGDMLQDLQALFAQQNGEVEEIEIQAEVAATPPARVVDENSPTVMVVEENSKMQDVFRKRLKERGYRVLVTSDPRRAVERFIDSGDTADVVVFSCGQIGEAALEAFNAFGEHDDLKGVAAVLLLDKHQAAWKDRANTANHRAVAIMPITLGQLRKLMARTAAAGKSLA